jgi:Cu+-exporting ATPase
MHPEIVRDGPGSCPICGMALEPMAAREEQENPELADMTRRFWGSLVLTLPVFAIAMAEMVHWTPLTAHFAPRTLAWVQLVLGTPVVLWGGWPFFTRGWASLRTLHLNMFTLIAIGTGAAWAYSAIAAALPGVFPASFRGPDGQVAVYFEAAAVIVTLVLLGQVLALRARSQTGAALRALLGLAPKTARRLSDDGSEEDVPLDSVRVGDRLRVRPGEKVPVDGIVLDMESAGVTLVRGDLRGSLRARRLSHRTMRNIRQNLCFAFVYNALGVPIAAGILYPALGILLSPMIAAAAMSLSSVSVIANSLRLRSLEI